MVDKQWYEFYSYKANGDVIFSYFQYEKETTEFYLDKEVRKWNIELKTNYVCSLDEMKDFIGWRRTDNPPKEWLQNQVALLSILLERNKNIETETQSRFSILSKELKQQEDQEDPSVTPSRESQEEEEESRDSQENVVNDALLIITKTNVLDLLQETDNKSTTKSSKSNYDKYWDLLSPLFNTERNKSLLELYGLPAVKHKSYYRY